jgi:hypothetical protein
MFHQKILIFIFAENFSQFRIRIGLNCWICISIESNADPKHCFHLITLRAGIEGAQVSCVLVLAQAARVSERGIALRADVARAAPVHALHMLLEVEAASGPVAAVGAGQQGRRRNLRHVFNISVADPGCLSRIPNFFHPESASKHLSILTQKNLFLSSRKYDPIAHPGSGSGFFFTHPEKV